MSFQLTKQIIKALCSRISYEKGEASYRNQQVVISQYDPVMPFCAATVKNAFHVTVRQDPNGGVQATCSCPSLASYGKLCQHTAAVLLNIYDLEQHSHRRAAVGTRNDPATRFSSHGSLDTAIRKAPASENPLTRRMLGLFSDRPLPTGASSHFRETRETIAVEFTCRPVTYGYRKFLFGIELKVGPKRLYIVQRIRDFLERIERGEAYVFTPHFTFDPRLHCFQQENEAVIRQLMQIMHAEKLYRETTDPFAVHSSRVSTERMLLIPPHAWDQLLPLLGSAPAVALEHEGRTYPGMQTSSEQPPLRFSFQPAQASGYQLEIQGIDTITVLESYGIILAEGKLIRLPREDCKRLAEMKNMLDSSRKQQIEIDPGQMEAFMQRVVPGLRKLGTVHIDKDIAERILQMPLNARLFLDRVKDRLLAGLEFQYGEIVINPLSQDSTLPSDDRILMRDAQKEQQILELIEQIPFIRTEGGYFLENEEAEYDFLLHVVPKLEQLLKVFATTAVKDRIHTGTAPVQVKVDVDDKINWLEIRFELDGIPVSEIRHLLKSLKEKRRYHRLPNGALVPLESAQFQEISRFVEATGVTKESETGQVWRLPLHRGMHLLDADQQGRTVKLGKSLRRLLENMRNPDNLDFPVPEMLSHVLRDYQVYGFQWMKTLAHYRFKGILADDMGLGKTLQSIAFLVSVMAEMRAQGRPALVIAPASLVYNWRSELQKFAPQLRVVIADGSSTDRARVLQDAANMDVIITSYPLLRKDLKLYAPHSFHTLILDEAQAFKNHTTQTAQAVKAIQATYRFALTGTPIENRLEELWSIFDAVFPELFGSKKAFHELPRETVAKRVRPFLLRRVKSDVLKELPEKIETLQTSELLPEQKKLYLAYLAQLQQETMKHVLEKDLHKNRIKILAGLTRLRQLCCHPALFVEGYQGSSGKFEQLFEIIEEGRDAGKRMLVYSQFTEMLGLIRRELGEREVPYFYLDGQTPPSERVELCNRFNDGERDLFLISLKAGGTGLNLTGADTVILYDLWWNPAVEQQAADRAHRIGQKNVVQVIRLATQGTVEEKMFELQQRKKHLIEEVIQPGHEALSTLTEQEIREILQID